MILTVCCNPCIDKYIYVSGFEKSTLNRVTGTLSCLGGKGINVAKAIAVLEDKAYAVGFMGENHQKAFSDELKTLGIDSTFSVFQGNTRTNYKINDTDGTITEMNEYGPTISQELQNDLLDKIKNIDCKLVVLSGSLPKGVPDTYYADIAKAINKPFAVDAEKGKLLPTLKYHPEIIKPNLHELEEISGRRLERLEDKIYECKKLITLGAKRVLLSMGSRGAILVDDKNCYMANAPKVDVKSTVGAGDTMLASSCISIIKGDTGIDILKKAVAGGTAAVMSDGTNPLSITNYNLLIKKIEVSKID